MEAPAGKRTLADIKNDIETYHNKKLYPGTKEDPGWRCKVCHSYILQTTLYVSEHDKGFGNACAGGGSVIKIALPFCPKCEGEPKKTSTCIHV